MIFHIFTTVTYDDFATISMFLMLSDRFYGLIFSKIFRGLCPLDPPQTEYPGIP